MSKDVVSCLKKDALSKAYFWNQYALDTNWTFLTAIYSMFASSKFQFFGGIKSNLARISDNFMKNKLDSEDEKIFRLNDLVRATVIANTPEETIEVYNILNE